MPHVWIVHLEDAPREASPPVAWRDLLDPEETARWRRLMRPRDRRIHVAAHALVRLALGERLGCPADRIRFGREPGGRPIAIHPAPPAGLGFSLTHTDALVAVAIGGSGPLGIDAEATDRVAVDAALAESVLPPAEAARAVDSPLLFFEHWTACEAVAKAEGLGLALPFPEIHLSGATALARGRHWRLWRDSPTPRHRLALAWRGIGEAPACVHRLEAADLTAWAERF